jgi:dimethylhistidine N-methyltransferase
MTTTAFREDILEGLKKDQKKLPSRYFYDELGDRIFQEIMAMPSYYLPSCEREILRDKSEAVFEKIKEGNEKIDVVELGAGDGTKTVELLRIGDNLNVIENYIPLDISPNILKVNEKNVKNVIPHLSVKPIAGDFFKTLKDFNTDSQRKLVLFMGGNIGNFPHEKAVSFLELLKDSLHTKDYILIAFDLKKNPKTILKAYNDDEGITKRFNLNILHRMNRELGCDINVDHFDHYPHYDPISGRTYSYLVSLEKQVIKIGDEVIQFDKNEVIHTEISKKYSLSDVEQLMNEAGLQTVHHFLDHKEFYTLSLVKMT